VTLLCIEPRGVKERMKTGKTTIASRRSETGCKVRSCRSLDRLPLRKTDLTDPLSCHIFETVGRICDRRSKSERTKGFNSPSLTTDRSFCAPLFRSFRLRVRWIMRGFGRAATLHQLKKANGLRKLCRKGRERERVSCY